MDKTAIKNFAVSARKKLIAGVSQKAYGLGISIDEIKKVDELPDGSRVEINNEYKYLNNTETKNREKLIEEIESKGYEQVMEEVAYTWFNRFIAIRFMECNEYLPSGVRVLSSEEASKVEPDAVTNAHELVEELKLNIDTVYKFQDNNDSEGLFKYVLIKQCNALGDIMPVMFEKIQDYTELLLPDNLLIEGSVVRDLVSNISEDDFKEQVEIIGWLYQYYIYDKKEKVINVLKGNKKIKKEDIPCATQLFTPRWIVEYLVENTLGSLWMDNVKSTISENWNYYIERSYSGNIDKIKNPTEIKFIDPSMGSGHILVYAFDVLYQIYVSVGYSEREIPRLILENNLYGLDIDDRAGQLAYFALMMKARSYSKRLFRRIDKDNPIKINICSIQESNEITKEDIDYFANGKQSLKRDIEYLVGVFIDAKEYGSILEINEVDFDSIENRLLEIGSDIADLFSKDIRERILNKVPSLVKQAKIMSKKYNVCTTNPPYMNNKGMDNKLKKFIDQEFKDVKFDLFSICMKHNFKYVNKNGYFGYMTPVVWMFIKSYEELRNYIIDNSTITSLIQLQHDSAFEDVSVGVCSFTIKNTKSDGEGIYIRLSDFYGIEVQPVKTLEAIRLKNVEYIYMCNQHDFKFIPGKPIAYWTSENIKNIFKNKSSIGDILDVKKGMDTGNNDIFLRMWNEVDYNKIGIGFKNSEKFKTMYKKWVPYNKGGEYRKWFGNNYYILNWGNNGEELKKSTANIRSKHLYFKNSITWTAVSTGKISLRASRHGSIFDSAGSSMFPNEKEYNYYLGLMNTKLANYIIDMINPTLNYGAGTISKFPVIESDFINCKFKIDDFVDENINISKKDWDSFEISWDFKKHPIIEFKSNNIDKSFNNWAEFTEKQFNQLKANEEELNRIFIDIYGLQDELTPAIEDKDITIRKADRERDIKSFISYAVGCMLGRYSLDEEGLVFAGGEFDINKYKTFKSDEDGIIPITDAEYFEDDIVSKFVEFVKVVFGEASVEENLNYIADTECFKRKANETSRDTLRRYFLKGFMEEHLKTYQKRPIYWMFDSGKQNGFKALIYMHRYDESMVAKIRTDYLHTLQRKYESEINRLDNDMNSDMVTAKEKANAKKMKEKIQKQLVECTSYDQVIAHVAHQRIGIELDDGVKVNYQKFQGVEVPTGDGKKALKADLLFKVKM